MHTPHLNKTILLVLIFAVVALHAIKGVGDDDASALRASSYLFMFPDDPLLQQLRDHLESNRANVHPLSYQRYMFRLSVWHNYMAQDVLTHIMERLPLYSPFQSVFLSTLILHLSAAITIFVLLLWLFGKDGNIIQVSLLLSVLFAPLVDLFPLRVLELFNPFPITDWTATWFVPASRAVALLFYFGVFLLSASLLRSSASKVKATPMVLVLVLLVASFVSHRTMMVLFLLPTLLVATVYSVFRYDPLKLIQRIGIIHFLALFNLCVLVAALVIPITVAVILDNNNLINAIAGARGNIKVGDRGILLVSLLSSNIVIYVWLRVRERLSDQHSELQWLGDLCLCYLVPFAIVTIGTASFTVDRVIRFSDLNYIVEIRERFAGLVHLLWWVLFGLCLYAGVRRDYLPALGRAAMTMLFLICIYMTTQLALHYRFRFKPNFTFSQRLMSVHVTSLLGEKGTDVYRNDSRMAEIIYFQAVANELRQKYLVQNTVPNP